MRALLTGYALASVLFAWALAGCAPRSTANGPAQIADRMTRAVYADDLATTLSYFDDKTKASVTRSQLGDMSDRMHALGEYQSLRQRSGDADSGKYEYDAAFTGGSMLVQLRLDPSGKVGAYRLLPQPAPAGGAPASAHG